MKSLNLAQPLILMVVGNPGAGKSFFAKQFSDTFGAPVVSIDRVRYELFVNPQYNADENDIVNRLTAYQIEELFKTRRTFLVDGACNIKAERFRLTQAAKKAGYGTLTIWVQTDDATAQARALKRNPRRADDQYNTSLTPELFQTFSRRFTQPTIEDYVVISGKHTYNTQAKMVLRKLVAPREAQAEAAHKSQTQKAPQHDIKRPGMSRRSVIIR